jgi:hypothetical protein
MNLTTTMTRFSKGLLFVLLCGLAGCAKPPDRVSGTGTIRLAATMVSPIDISVEWTDGAAGAAGYVLEYTSDPKEDYVPLGFFPPNHTRFAHSRLMPRTKFFYRVRPYYGAASNPVEVSLPAELTDEAFAAAFALPEDYEWAPPAILPEMGTVAKSSLRSAPANATPSDLRAQLMSPPTVSGIRLTWTDHADDEQGFLLETRPGNSAEFGVSAQVEPNVNSFGWMLEPPNRKGAFRIRAFYYGPPSNVVMKETGRDPEFGE